MELYNLEASTPLSAKDVIVAIEGARPSKVVEARRQLMGEAGGSVRVRYKHRDARTAISSLAEAELNRQPMPPSHRHGAPVWRSAAPPASAGGLGRTAARLASGAGLGPGRTGLSEEQEGEVLLMLEELCARGVGDKGDFLRRRHQMIPTLFGIKRLTAEVSRRRPEWRQLVERPGVLLGLLRRAGAMDDPATAASWLGPGSYATAQAPLDHPLPTSPAIPHSPRGKELSGAEKQARDEALRSQALLNVFGRPLSTQELGELSVKARRRMDAEWRRLRAVDQPDFSMDLPGPAHYRPEDCVGFGAAATRPGPTGPAAPGPALGIGKRFDDPAFKASCGPGPAAYSIRHSRYPLPTPLVLHLEVCPHSASQRYQRPLHLTHEEA